MHVRRLDHAVKRVIYVDKRAKTTDLNVVVSSCVAKRCRCPLRAFWIMLLNAICVKMH